MSYKYAPTDLKIFKAALHDDWNSVSEIFEQDPELTTKTITRRLETPLMIAVGTNSSPEFVERLVERLDEQDFEARNEEGNTALHYAAKAGNIYGLCCLATESNLQLPNNQGKTPLILAASLGRKDMVETLLRLFGFNSAIWTYNEHGANLLALTIQAGYIDEALRLVKAYPLYITQDNDSYSRHPLEILATKPELFLSGRRIGFWAQLIYSLIPVYKRGALLDEDGQVQAPAILLADTFVERRIIYLCKSFRRILQYVAPRIVNISDTKLKHIQTKKLVKEISRIVIENGNDEITWKILGSTIATAVGHGIYDLIEECILAYPSIIWYSFGGCNLFHLAIMLRQEKVYNLVYQMSNHKAFVASYVDEEEENALHIAAKLAPQYRLNIMAGAALQMQRELQWFKEVESFVEPSYREALNIRTKTPRMIFTDQHKDLLKEGQQWMKDTASSCTVVAALIVTIAFAAIFTVPGGNKDDDGKPMFLNKKVFMIFTISDAIALFSSSTSVLMFLGILTSRYAEDDFLYALPQRMTIGLVSLFLSLAATLITFSATLALVLQDKVTWIAAPLVIMTSIPVCLFVFLQFPLLMELVFSTYGRSIFRKQNDRMIY